MILLYRYGIVQFTSNFLWFHGLYGNINANSDWIEADRSDFFFFVFAKFHASIKSV